MKYIIMCTRWKGKKKLFLQWCNHEIFICTHFCCTVANCAYKSLGWSMINCNASRSSSKTIVGIDGKIELGQLNDESILDYIEKWY